MTQSLDQLALEISKLLAQSARRIVFAESCTGGLVSATLARIPGISNFLCGSAVVYRIDTKMKWLGIPESILIDPGPVSEPVARQMAEAVLALTPEANLAASITGHLGPNAPVEQDGLIFVGIAERGVGCEVFSDRLSKFPSRDSTEPGSGNSQREQRQSAAAQFVLSKVAQKLLS